MSDERFNIDLIRDITDVLDRHGYKLPDGDLRKVALGKTVSTIIELTDAYEGRKAKNVAYRAS